MSKHSPSWGVILGAILGIILIFAVVVGCIYGFWVLVAWLIVATFGLSYNIWLLGLVGLVGTMIVKNTLRSVLQGAVKGALKRK